MSLDDKVRQLAEDQGASLVGVAPVERFEGAPAGHGPKDFVPNAKSVIVVGVKVPDAIVEYDRYPQHFTGKPWFAASSASSLNWAIATRENLYFMMGHGVQDMHLNDMATRIALLLEKNDYRALPTPNTDLRYGGPDRTVMPLTNYYGIFSQRHAAVRAGLGEFGYNNIVVTPQYGPRVRFNSIITEAELEPTPLLTDPVCLREACHRDGPRCLDRCTPRALQRRESINKDQVFLLPPVKTDGRLCIQMTGSNERNVGCFYYGTCMRVCPVGKRVGKGP